MMRVALPVQTLRPLAAHINAIVLLATATAMVVACGNPGRRA